MDFYSRQAAARTQTRWLVLGFLVAVAAVVVALDLVLFSLLAFLETDRPGFAPVRFAAHHPGAALLCTVALLAVIGLASLYKSLQLRSGGGVVARSVGGVRVEPDTRDLKRQRLRNVVEEMAIASGVPVPEVYVLEHESAINAFAAGHTPANAAVAVTQGALDHLNREQLQGVIAHEFSHVVNGDMRLNVQLLGWLFGLFVIALIGRTILRIAPRSDRKGGGLVLLAALAVVVLGSVGLLAGRILQAAVSRQRERLADASAVQFTRNPGGLKMALLKISGFHTGSRLDATGTEEVAHMLFAPGVKRWFSTHPPLVERIQALDPGFNAQSLSRLAALALGEDSGPEAPLLSSAAVSSAMPFDQLGRSVPAAPQRIADQVGSLDTVHLEYAHALRLTFPASLLACTTSAVEAKAVVLALLTSRDETVRNRQLTRLANRLEPAQLQAVRRCLPQTETLAPMLRLPALFQAFPLLRRLPSKERLELGALADELIVADARIDVFEFCLAVLLGTLLRDELDARASHGNLALRQVRPELQLLFAVLGGASALDPHQARAACDAGMAALGLGESATHDLQPDWAERLRLALARLEKLQLPDKRLLIEALVRTVAHDAMLNVAEAELLRTVCAILHCPMPPLLPATTPAGA